MSNLDYGVSNEDVISNNFGFVALDDKIFDIQERGIEVQHILVEARVPVQHIDNVKHQYQRVHDHRPCNIMQGNSTMEVNETELENPIGHDDVMKSLHININEPEENSIALKLPMGELL
ncbi:hypothetical protein M9H77_25488 [Catharanthus roseus]|uniref:Uncharacterized protein n=1 Tax=Catharanthus roseus TaxID=4058 RepID=A0ACC0A727_CATRO|nr:hypothetical protein M9H77_25488 [Catharanthus roseus]